jgi:DNA gyrase subunit B
LTSKIYFHFYDERKNTEHHYYFEGGIMSLLRELNKNKTVVHEPIYVHGSDEENGVDVEVAIQYNDTFQENTPSYVNIINTHEGGTHLAGFKTALTKVIKDYSVKKEMVKTKDDTITGDDVREGLTAVISLKMPSKDLQFEGQTKANWVIPKSNPLLPKLSKMFLRLILRSIPTSPKPLSANRY